MNSRIEKKTEIFSGMIIPNDYNPTFKKKTHEKKQYNKAIKTFINSFNCGCAKTLRNYMPKPLSTSEQVAQRNKEIEDTHMNRLSALFNELLSIDKDFNNSLQPHENTIKPTYERSAIKRSTLTFSKIFGNDLSSKNKSKYDEIIIL
jgi:hypothetical protein